MRSLFRYSTLLTSTSTLFLRPTASTAFPIINMARTASSSSPPPPSSQTTTTRSAARTALDEHGTDGAFVRKDSAYRNWIVKGKSVIHFISCNPMNIRLSICTYTHSYRTFVSHFSRCRCDRS